MKRLSYGESHWSRMKDQKIALDQYLALGAKPMNRVMEQFFIELAGDVYGKKVLDYGGGAGILSVQFAAKGAHVVLVDAEMGALNLAMYYAKLKQVENNILPIQSEAMPRELKNGEFDIVLLKDVMEHIADDESFLIGLYESMKPGGFALLSTQNKLALNYLLEGSYEKYWCKNANWVGWDQTHVRFYTPSSIGRKLKNANILTKQWRSAYIIPYDILDYLFLFKLNIDLFFLSNFDRFFGKIFPFNKIGFNFLVKAYKN